MKKFLALLPTLLLLSMASYAQFAAPVKHQMFLAGNVGEVRATHFHAGIDIKATHGVGSDIIAVKEGYISRIGVSPTGYGNVVYVTHPCGHVSVYAHLDRFPKEIEKWVETQQYTRKSFAVNLYPMRTLFPVETGQVIGYMGNSGSSMGPHLHFEIRNPQGQPLNINHHRLYQIADTIPPTLYKVVLYEADTLQNIVTYHPTDTIDMTTPGTKTLNTSRNFYLAYQLIDHKNSVPHTFGVYSLEQIVDSTVNYAFELPHTDYGYSKYVRTFTQYDMQRKQRYHVIRAYQSQHNWLPFYKNVRERGIIAPPPPGGHKIITTTLIDDTGNPTIHSFIVRGDTTKTELAQPVGMPVWCNLPFNYNFGSFSINMARETTYDNHFLPFSVDSTGRVFTLGDSRYPIHKPITVDFTMDSIPAKLRTKTMLYDKQNKASALIHHKQGTHTAKINTMGVYEMMVDTLPPTIKYNGLRNGRVVLTVKDNLSGISKYSIKVDGQWVLGQWDPKFNRYTYTVTANATPKSHKVTVNISDAVGNKTEKNYTIKW